jgi:hypothetical protein
MNHIMKPSIKNLLIAALIGTCLAVSPNLNAQNEPAGAAQTTKAKRDWYPFSGTVDAVDAQAMTISLAKTEGVRVLQMDSKTTLERNGKPATLEDVKAGNYLHGKLHKNAANAEVITDAKIELAPPAKGKGTSQIGAAAATAADETSTNAPVKKTKKKKAASTTATNAPPAQ